MRKESTTIQKCNSRLTALGLNSDAAFHRSKLILKIYRDVVWVLSERAEELQETAWIMGEQDIESGLCYLENFAPDIELQAFEEKVCCLVQNQMLVNIIDRALLRLKRYPDRGELYYEILTKQFIYRFNSTEKELLEELNIERSVFYDRKREAIENGSAYIFVNKELQRVTRGALDDLSDKGVIKKFPPCIASTHTALVLKEPKTKTSIRRVYLPKTVAYMLVERKKEIDELMDLFGDEYIDNNLVFCSSNGRPMESQVINRAFNKLIKENGLPHVVFHSLRHSSITYKLKLNGGDMKSVQGDSGHAQVKMVADVYSHIIDEDRCINAQRLEEAFYSSKTPDPVEDTEPKTADTAVTESDESDAAKILELLKNPETAALLKQLAKAL